MSELTAGPATRAPAAPDLGTVDADHAPADHPGKPSRVWVLLEALAYAGAYIDPSGILAVHRLRQAMEEEERNGHRR